LIGKGNALYEAQLQKYTSGMIEKLTLRGWYVLPFCDNIRSAWSGSMDGGFFAITFPGNGTQHVSTFTLTNSANDGGAYKFFASNKLNGETDISNSLAYNANTTTMKAAIEAMMPISNQGFTVTASGAATSTFTLTWNARDGRVSDVININMLCESLNDGGVGEISTVSQSTYGFRGWNTIASGSNFVEV